LVKWIAGMQLGLQQMEINSELKYDTSGVLLGKVPSNWRSLLLFLLTKKITKGSISSAALGHPHPGGGYL